MDAQELIDQLHAKSVAIVCPACGSGTLGGVTEMGAFIGAYCGHCGHLRLFHRETLEAAE
jgi:ribosomal protein L32